MLNTRRSYAKRLSRCYTKEIAVHLRRDGYFSFLREYKGSEVALKDSALYTVTASFSTVMQFIKIILVWRIYCSLQRLDKRFLRLYNLLCKFLPT